MRRQVVVIAILIGALTLGCSQQRAASGDVGERLEQQFEQQNMAGVDVSADNSSHTLTLSGNVRNDAEKQQAEQLARQMAAGFTVQNDLEIDPEQAEAANTLHQTGNKVGEAANSAGAAIGSAAGQLGNQAEKAGEKAADKAGNAVSAIDENIENAFRRISTELRLPGVDIHNQDGNIILTGIVENEQQKQQAEDAARKLEGVKRVENHIIVRPEKAGGDTQDAGRNRQNQ